MRRRSRSVKRMGEDFKESNSGGAAVYDRLEGQQSLSAMLLTSTTIG